MNRLDMSAFVGGGFDLEYRVIERWSFCYPEWLRTTDDTRYSGEYDLILNDTQLLTFDNIRPRLNKPQVLDDYGKVLVDGLVWRALMNHREFKVFGNPALGETSDMIREDLKDGWDIVWLECIGLENKPEWHEEAKRLDMPLVDV